MTQQSLDTAADKMHKAVIATKEEFALIRSGRANPQMFSKLIVNYYGAPTPLEQLASLQNPEARTIVITPYDKSVMGEIEKTLRDSPSLGVNPTNDGNLIRASMPELTEERRKEYVKVTRDKAEAGKVSIRNIRRHAKDEFEQLKKDGEASDDDVSRAEKELEAMTKKHVDQIDESLKNKEAELLEV